MEVSVRELKARLSEYLRRAADGEEVIVTSRGKVVARLSGPRPARRPPSNATKVLALLRSQPWIRPREGGRRIGLHRPTRLRNGTTADLVRWVRGG
jgi:prevent-host-death family protein